jgi:2'-5' RNA ligase
VSVVYPFVPPAMVDDEFLDRLGGVVGSVPSFDCTFARTAWFDDDVLWLAPDPDGPFRRLIQSVVSAFPAYQPYGGIHGEPVPHLTVGERRLARDGELTAAENAVRQQLPVPARVDRAVLLAGRPERGAWQPVAEFRLGDAD